MFQLQLGCVASNYMTLQTTRTGIFHDVFTRQIFNCSEGVQYVALVLASSIMAYIHFK